MIVIDVNVLLYAHNSSSPYHERSRSWLEQVLGEGETLGIPWHTFIGFLRLTTTAQISQRPLNHAQAYSLIQAWVSNPQVTIPEPGRRFWRVLQQIGSDGQTRGRSWSDAYLAALAIENGAQFASFDRDFRKFSTLKLIEL